MHPTSPLGPPENCLPVPPATDRLAWDPARIDPATLRDLRRRAEADLGSLRDVWGDRLTRLDIDITALGPIGSLELSVKEQR